MQPLRSEANPNNADPLATITPDPPDEPPGVLKGSQGLTVTPKMGFSHS